MGAVRNRAPRRDGRGGGTVDSVPMTATPPRPRAARPALALLGALLLAAVLTGCSGRSDSIAPVVSITDPKSGTTRTTDDLTIVGYAMDDRGVASIKINGTDVLADPSYAGERGKRLIRFRFTVNGLADGQVTTHIDVTDVSGRTSSETYALTIDNTPPSLELGDVRSLGGGQVHVEGTASDNDRVASITIDGQPLAFTPAAEVPFSVDVSAKSGAAVVVEDSAGNRVSQALP